MTGLPSSRARRRARQSERAVEIQIGTLALHGVVHADATAVATALSDELSRLAAQKAFFLPSETGHLVAAPYVAGGPTEVGRGVAAALWAGLRQQGRAT